MEVYSTMSKPWCHLLQEHTTIHAWTRSQDRQVKNGVATMYFHTSKTTLNKCIEAKDLGSRYLFTSCLQAVAHRVIHHHFGLSAANLESKE
eukprot:79354-Amphidinium_carterae.1